MGEPDRLDRLEQLQRLREAGVLEEAEFRAEKLRLLGGRIEPPRSSPPPRGPIPRSHWVARRLPYAAVILLVLALIVAGIFWLKGVSPKPEARSAAIGADRAGDDTAAGAAADIRSLSADRQLDEAFRTAFGRTGKATVILGDPAFPEHTLFLPGKLVWTGDTAVLVSEGKVQDAGHVAAGKLAVHYLSPVGMSFSLDRKFVPALESGSFGAMSEWGISTQFGSRPVVYAEGGGTWQCYTCAVTTLIELAPSGPIQLASFQTYYDNVGNVGEESPQATTIDGKIEAVVPGLSFDVRYRGARAFVEHYVRKDEKYVPAGGKSRMDGC